MKLDLTCKSNSPAGEGLKHLITSGLLKQCFNRREYSEVVGLNGQHVLVLDNIGEDDLECFLLLAKEKLGKLATPFVEVAIARFLSPASTEWGSKLANRLLDKTLFVEILNTRAMSVIDMKIETALQQLWPRDYRLALEKISGLRSLDRRYAVCHDMLGNTAEAQKLREYATLKESRNKTSIEDEEL